MTALFPVLAAGALVLGALLVVRPRAAEAALALTVGGALEAGIRLLGHFVSHELLFAATPVVHAAAAGAVMYGLLQLVDALFPKTAALPPALSRQERARPNLGPRLVVGAFAGLWLARDAQVSGRSALLLLADLGALALVLGVSILLSRREELARWVLERRPERVVWTYVHQVTVTNRKTGSQRVYWTANLGLSDQLTVGLLAGSDTQAEAFVLAVAQHCPGVAVGASDENRARFQADPAAMRRG